MYKKLSDVLHLINETLANTQAYKNLIQFSVDKLWFFYKNKAVFFY